jgi:hypothetical protein
MQDFADLEGTTKALMENDNLTTVKSKPFPSKEVYVAAIKAAADSLVADRYLLPEDASRLVSQAEHEGVRLAP